MLTTISRAGIELIKNTVFIELLDLKTTGCLSEVDYCTIVYRLMEPTTVYSLDWTLFLLQTRGIHNDIVINTLLPLVRKNTITRKDKISHCAFECFRGIYRAKSHYKFETFSRVIEQWLIKQNDHELLGHIMQLSWGIDFFWDDCDLLDIMFGDMEVYST